MKSSIVVMTVGLVVAASPVFAGATLDIEPGMWESEINVKMEGMPMALPPQTHKQCLTAQDIADGENGLIHPASVDPNQKCHVKGHEHKGNTIDMRMVCTSKEGSSNFSGKIIIDSRTAYHGGFDADVVTELGPVKMHQTFSGKRTGDCSK